MSETATLSPRQRILESVITCIEQFGIENLTTRKIAEQAGANIASINYYFRSKDLLVDEALAMTLQHMLDDIAALIHKEGQPFLLTLEEVFVYLIEGGLRFPRVILAHLYAVLVEKRYDAPVVLSMQQVLDQLAEGAAREFPQASQDSLRLALVQIFSSVFFTMLAPGFFQLAGPLDFARPGAPRELARSLTCMFAKNITS